MNIVQKIEAKYLREQKVDFAPGDTIAVHQKIMEGDKERIQIFQGVVMGRRGGGTATGASFTVRKVTQGIAVEKVYPLHSPNIAKIERIRTGRVRRAKLNYLRNRSGKAARIDERKQDLTGE
ncbi:MAG: 50S ribosomal protein L19 [bacterium]|nr:50S ribosomal protein L19 [bacterium]